MAETYRTGPPYKLMGKRLVFTNWHFVEAQTGQDWFFRDGEKALLKSAHDPLDPDILWKPVAPNFGVRLVCRAAVRTGPVFHNDKPWDERGLAACILRDGGLFRAWASTGWHFYKDDPNNGLTYLESADGFNWEKPDLGICAYGGNTHNNFVSRGVWQLHPGNVFIDEQAPASERYKWINEEYFTSEQARTYLQDHQGSLDWKVKDRYAQMQNNGLAGNFAGARGAVSSDGLHWTFIERPLVLTYTDTHPTCYYDKALQKYVAYFRDYQTSGQPESSQTESGTSTQKWIRRAIGRSESDDFRAFPIPKLVLVPDLSFSPNQVLYTNCRTTIPGAPDHHLMFPSVWDTGDDTCSVVAASSFDGRLWQYLPSGPVLTTGDPGSWDGGYLFAYPDLLELPGGDFALPYTGFNLPHKYPRERCKRNVGYALWPKGRIMGIEATEEGAFCTTAIIPGGNTILLNAVTKRAGYVRTEVCDISGNVIAGHSFEDCMPLFGDCYRRRIVWKSSDKTGVGPDQPIVLRFRLRCATLYGLDFI